MLAFFDSIIASAENKKAPYFHYIILFAFMVIARNSLEVMAYTEFKFNDFGPQLHYSAYYAALITVLIWVISSLVGESSYKVSKAIFSFSFFILLCPIIDLIALKYFGIKQTLGYLSKELHGDLFSHYFTFFGNHLTEKMGPTIGYRLEIAAILVGFIVYLYSKTKNALKTILGAIIIYTILFLFCGVPYLMFYLPRPYSPQIIPFYLLVFTLFLPLAVGRTHPKAVLAVLKDIRPLRMLFYVLILLYGIKYGLANGGTLGAPNYYIVVMTCLAVVYAWIYSVMSNNLADTVIDSVSNQKRPTISGVIPIDWYSTAMWVMLAMSLIVALRAHWMAFIITILYIGNYHIYSNEPLRLKRYFIISKAPIAINIFLLFALGSMYTGVPIEQLPLNIIAFILVGSLLGLNIIDIKDEAGDRAAGIKTLPVVVGLQNAKYITAAITLIGYCASFVVLGLTPLYYFIVVIGMVQAIVISTKLYSDNLVIGLLAFSILVAYFA